MKSKKPERKKSSELRKRAEERLKSVIIRPGVISEKETRKLVHELQVHQIELEMQNEELRKSQSELEESRLKYSDLYDFAPVGYFTFDKNGLTVEANLTAAKELGVERALMINKPFRTFIVVEDRNIFDQHLRNVLTSEDRKTCELRLKRKNRTEFYAQLESIAVLDSGGADACRTSCIDITSRRQLERSLLDALAASVQHHAEISALLEASRAVSQYRNFMDAAEAIFKSCKNVTGATAGYIAMVSRDGTRNEVVFLDSGGLICSVDPDLPMPIRGMRGEVFSSGNAIYHNDFPQSGWAHFLPEGHVQLENALMAPMIIENKVIGLLGLGNKLGGFTDNDVRIASAFSDLAAIALKQKKAEEELIDSNKHISGILDSISEGFISIDRRMTVTYFNRAAEKLLGRKSDDVIGCHLFNEAFPEAKGSIFEERYTWALKENKPVVFEAHFDVQPYENWYEVRVYPYIDGIAVYFQVITERKYAEDLRRNAYDKLETLVQERAEKLEKLNEILTIEKNNLRNILDAMPDGVYIVNQFHVIEFANPVLLKEFGPVKARPCYQYFHDRTEPCPWCKNEEVFSGKSVKWEWYSEKTNKTYELFDTPVINEDGTISKLELFHDITNRKRAEKGLEESREQLRNLYTHQQSAVEAERTKIAREIHDEFGTILTALNIDLSWMEKKLPGDQHTLIERINKDIELINSAIKVVQRISSELRPGVLDYLGLSSAVEWQVKEFGNRTGIDWDISIDMKITDLDKNISIALFRILQESLTNVARYAEASKIKVKLAETDSVLTLDVTDDGKGISEEQLSDPHSLGILGIRERVQYLGGDIDIKGAPNKGTRVTVRVPLAKQG